MPKTHKKISALARQAAREAYDACSEPPLYWDGDLLLDYAMEHATSDEWVIYDRTFREEWHKLASLASTGL